MPSITIFFYTLAEPYGFLSNFYMRNIVVGGITYKSTEHYYQAMKSTDPDVQELIRGALTPKASKTMARKQTLRLDWEEVVGTPHMHKFFEDSMGVVVERVKDHFMYLALIEKFTQHEDLKERLLNTGRATLVEDSPIDYYWGNGSKKDGLNKLGRMLMLVRTKLQLDKHSQFEHKNAKVAHMGTDDGTVPFCVGVKGMYTPSDDVKVFASESARTAGYVWCRKCVDVYEQKIGKPYPNPELVDVA